MKKALLIALGILMCVAMFAACSKTPAHTHTFGEAWKSDSSEHWKECECGEKSESAAHSGGTATCTEKAKCEVCGAEYGNLLAHDYTVIKHDDAKHWRECSVCGTKDDSSEETHRGGTATCTELAVCEVCQAEYGEMLAHDFTELRHDENNHWYECSVCGTKDDSSEETHMGGTATCTEKAKCEVCQAEYGEMLPHDFTELRHDENNHWYECSVCGTKDDSSEEAHTGGTATCTEKAKCDVCGVEYGEFAEHEFSILHHDADGHWYECSVCNIENDKEDHTYVWEDDGDVHTGTCSVCSETTVINTALNVRQELNRGLRLVTEGDEKVVARDGVIESVDLSGVGDYKSILSIKIDKQFEPADVEFGTDPNNLDMNLFTKNNDSGETNMRVLVTARDGKEFTVTVPVLLVSQYISTKEELKDWYTLALKLNNASARARGYFKLKNNIAYNDLYSASAPRGWTAGGSWEIGVQSGFAGVFDGDGYNIEGIEIEKDHSAFVTLLNKDGVIKNVSFTKAKNDKQGTGLVCAWGQGLIENVYVKYTSFTQGGWKGTFYSCFSEEAEKCGGDGPTVRDCFADFLESAVTDSDAYKAQLIGGAKNKEKCGKLQGVYTLCSKTSRLNQAVGLGTFDDSVWGAFKTAELLAADTAAQAELATWNTTYWTITEGVPVFKTKA